MNSELQNVDLPKHLLAKIVAFIELNIGITEAIPIIYYYNFLFFHAVHW